MKYIRSLLQRYSDIPTDLSSKDLGDIITKHIAEVEEIIDQKQQFHNIVVGCIKEIHPHPNADKLKITKTDIGEQIVQIVCGGTNIREGQKVVVSKLGAKVKWHGEETLTEMKKAKVRGEESLGMICAAEEVFLENDFAHKASQIVELPNDAPTGTNIADYLGKNDTVFDIDNKSLTHRPDLWGHYGMARDIAAALQVPFKKLAYDGQMIDSNNQNLVEVAAKDFCKAFVLRSITTGLPKPSPDFIQNTLRLSGIRPKNSLIDVTNFVMLELGQPMHAYDKRDITGQLRVRMAQNGEKIVTLDEVNREMGEREGVIVDDEKILGVAGVMGGYGSGIKDDTTQILLEAAHFDAVSVRKTSTRLGLSTDAARRFEKSLSPSLTILAVKRASEILQEIHGDTYQMELEEAYFDPSIFTKTKISFDPNHVSKIMGKPVDTSQSILARLGFEIDNTSLPWQVTAPLHRPCKDINLEVDLVEEVARMIGYEDVTSQPLQEEVSFPIIPTLTKCEKELGNLFVGMGFYETMTYSFVGESLLTKLGQSSKNLIPLRNTLSKDHTHLRDSLLPNMLEYVDRSLKHTKEIRVFEVGQIFSLDDPKKFQKQAISIIVLPEFREDPEVLYEAKGVVESILQTIKCKSKLQSSSLVQAHPYRQCQYMRGKDLIASAYELHPSIIRSYKWKNVRVAVVELNLGILQESFTKTPQYKPPVNIPEVIKGISLYLDTKVLVGDVTREIQKLSSLIHSCKVTDYYEGQGVPEGKKAVGIEVRYLDQKKTLEEKDVEEIHQKVLGVVEGFGGEVRVI